MSGAAAAGGLLEQLRAAELEQCRHSFLPGMRVLDFGGGSGFQAGIMASWGCDVTSIDLAGRAPAPHTYFPVQDYDGRRIPFADGTFDVVFSSNVLEHIADLPPVLAELRRVMKRDGSAIHVLPSPAWRLWTSMTHYPFLLKVLVGKQRERGGDVGDAVRRVGLGGALRRALYPNAHGEYPGALAELYYFSRRRWRRVFEAHGFVVERESANGLFCTGHTLAPGLSLERRRRLARRLGSSCHIFVLHAGETANA